MRTSRLFDALPPYLGGKRRLAPLILADLAAELPAAEWPGASFCDPMCGGGAVALAAKAQGFEVYASDRARRGAIVAAALDLPPQNRSRSCARIRGGAKGVGMARKRYAAEEIIGKLREAEVVLAQGEAVAQVARRLGVAEPTYYRWRREYGGLRVDQAKRLKELERENSRLKRLVADQALANAMLRDVAAGNFCARPSGTGRHPPARTSTRCRSGGPARSPARRGRHSAPCPGRPRMRRR